jgi:hypothetical protein
LIKGNVVDKNNAMIPKVMAARRRPQSSSTAPTMSAKFAHQAGKKTDNWNCDQAPDAAGNIPPCDFYCR